MIYLANLPTVLGFRRYTSVSRLEMNLYKNCRMGNRKGVKRMLDNGEDVNGFDWRNPLLVAVSTPLIEAVR